MKKTNLPTFSLQDYFKLSAQSSQKAYDKTACTRKKYTLLSLNPIKINNVYMEMNWWSVFVQHLTHWQKKKKNSQIHVNSNELVFTFHFSSNLFISVMGFLSKQAQIWLVASKAAAFLHTLKLEFSNKPQIPSRYIHTRLQMQNPKITPHYLKVKMSWLRTGALHQMKLVWVSGIHSVF